MPSTISTEKMLSVRKRWDNDDKRTATDLAACHEFLAGSIDPILSPVVEKTILYRPKDIAGFMADCLAGTTTAAAPSTGDSVGHKEYLKTEVDPIVKEMVIEVTKMKPKNVKKAMEDHLRSKATSS